MYQELIRRALEEDLGDGDHSSLACVPENAKGKATLYIKDDGVLAGVELACEIFKFYDPDLQVDVFIQDGARVKKGDVALEVRGAAQSILSTERLVLNFMQRMSGIATQTRELVDLTEGSKTQILDTRKTTPGLRLIEKWAVRIGGAMNHRMGLYDMIMLKDNHIDFAGGIAQAIERTRNYLKENSRDLKIEIEVRNEEELKEVLEIGGVDRIMLDNFSPERISKALEYIPESYEVEASGGITRETLKSYAATGVDFISIGALTHSFQSLDMSLKADFS
ncbi:MAG: carboxylating nicotinate-nucleotide diphosphorylase [Bacteroidetes bacterium]|nr:MAG: carboxylating nicotinate-nucleotide diphosphorylase [Bacteroidota bacterium]